MFYLINYNNNNQKNMKPKQCSFDFENILYDILDECIFSSKTHDFNQFQTIRQLNVDFTMYLTIVPVMSTKANIAQEETQLLRNDFHIQNIVHSFEFVRFIALACSSHAFTQSKCYKSFGVLPINCSLNFGSISIEFIPQNKPQIVISSQIFNNYYCCLQS